MTTKKLAITIGILLSLIVVTLFSFISPGKDTTSMPGHLTDENNNTVSIEDYRGQVVFINNWASWCPPCIAEMPSIQQLKHRLKNEKVVFLMVSFDEKKDKALNFVKKKGLDFQVYFPGTEYPYPTSSIPATFIIDKNGKVVAEQTGMADYNSNEVYEFLVKLSRE